VSLSHLWQKSIELVRAIYHMPSLMPATIAFLYAAAMCSISYPFGFATVSDTASVAGTVKEVGYISAINWSFAFLVLFPLIVFFLFEAFASIPDSIRALAKRRMLVDENLQPVEEGEALEDWENALNSSAKVAAGLMIVAVIEPLIEWWATSGYPLLKGRLDLVAEHEYDWSVGALLMQSSSLIHRLANALFSLFVFVQQSMMIFAFALVLILTALFCVFFGKQRLTWQIVPVASDRDPHKGFQIFEAPITHLLSAALLSLTIFYCSILQNYYLRTSYESISEFCRKDVLAGAASIKDNNPDVPSMLGVAPSHLIGNVINFSVGQTRLGGLLALLVILGAPLWILRGVAKRGAIAANYTAKIEYWPLSYVSLNTYLVICVVAGLSLVFYRVGLWIFGALAFALLARCFTAIYRRVLLAKPQNRRNG
jgi:hypothetical protein